MSGHIRADRMIIAQYHRDAELLARELNWNPRQVRIVTRPDQVRGYDLRDWAVFTLPRISSGRADRERLNETRAQARARGANIRWWYGVAVHAFTDGEIIRQGKERYRVEAIHPDRVHVWLRRVSDDGLVYGVPFTGIGAAYEKLPTFFEGGKAYARKVSWSITAQRQDVEERFWCESVRKNSDNGVIAFGKLTILDDDGEAESERWIILDNYSFRNKTWEEVT